MSQAPLSDLELQDALEVVLRYRSPSTERLVQIIEQAREANALRDALLNIKKRAMDTPQHEVANTVWYLADEALTPLVLAPSTDANRAHTGGAKGNAEGTAPGVQMENCVPPEGLQEKYDRYKKSMREYQAIPPKQEGEGA